MYPSHRINVQLRQDDKQAILKQKFQEKLILSFFGIILLLQESRNKIKLFLPGNEGVMKDPFGGIQIPACCLVPERE